MSNLTDETSTPESAEQIPETGIEEATETAAEALEPSEESAVEEGTEAIAEAAPEVAAEEAEPEASEEAQAETTEVEATSDSAASEEAPSEPESDSSSDAAAEAVEAVPESEAPEVEESQDAVAEAVEVAPEPEATEAPEIAENDSSSDAAAEAVEVAPEPEATELPEIEASPEAATEEVAAAAVEASEPEASEVEASEVKASEVEESDSSPEAPAEATEPEASESESASEAPVGADEAVAAAEATEADAAGTEPAASEAEEKPAVLDAAMAELDQAMKEKTLVKGQVIGWNKGGYHVAIGKTAAFCPVSQIEIGNPRGPKRYLDKTFSFRVIEIQNGGRRVVLSRAAAIKAERDQKAALVKELLQPGAELEGKVSSLTDFGAFVELGGGIEGLVHVSEISRRRVEHPKEVLKKGQQVKVSVMKIEKGGQRISLSMKRLEPDPWKGVADRFPAGSQFKGTVLRKADFGLFVEVEPGLEGLVHTSRLGLGQSLEHEDLQVGQEVGGWVHEVEARRRRLSLSLREVAGGNPWQGVSDKYPVGEVVKGRVERLASFGVFIELEPGLTGLLPFSVLGAVAAGNPRRQYHAGKEVSIRVLSIDRDKRRISLGTESSKAEGNQQDYREYLKKSKSRTSSSSGMNAMAAAFAKLKG